MKPYPIFFDVDASLRGAVKFIHNGKEASVNAFDIDEEKTIRLLLPRTFGAACVYIQIFSESDLHCISELKMTWNGLFEGFDAYDVVPDAQLPGLGLYFFKFKIQLPTKVVYGVRSEREVSFVEDSAFGELFQLTLYHFVTNEPSAYYGGVIYHIFVDRFNRGGDFTPKEGAIYVSDWTHGVAEYPEYPGAPLKNNTFYGGTLWGIIDKLDYIKSLGVNLIYLSPIFDSASNHKYDTGDYMTVDGMFGGEEALRALIKAADERDMGIILDGVFNHTGSDSLYFNREGNYSSVGAYQSKRSKYYSWYDFKEYPNKYTCWWDIDILPRINLDKPDCRAYFVGREGVVDKYSKMGIAGFRLDVVDELSDDFVTEIKARLNLNNPHSVLYGEVWEDASNKIAYGKRKKYYLGAELDGVMNYPVRRGIVSFLTKGETAELAYALGDVIDNAPERVSNMQMNLLGTHDTERILTVLGGESSAGRSNSYLYSKRMNDIERGTAKRRLRMAYTILATLPGIPVIFYGDETSLEGYHDPFNRMPYPWDMQDMKMIAFYQKIGKIRRENNVYAQGDFTLALLKRDLLVFTRGDDERTYTTYVNNSKYTRSVSFDTAAIPMISGESSAKEFSIPAFSAEIFVTPRGSNIIVD